MNADAAAVTAVGGGVGQSVLRALCLSQESWRVVGYDVDPWSAGLYAVSRGRLPPPASSAEYLDSLCAHLRQDGAGVLIPGSDSELPTLARARETLRSAGVIPLVGSAEAVGLCRDKLAT